MLKGQKISYNQLRRQKIKFEISGWSGKGNKRHNFYIGYNNYDIMGNITSASILTNPVEGKDNILYFPTATTAQKCCNVMNALLED